MSSYPTEQHPPKQMEQAIATMKAAEQRLGPELYTLAMDYMGPQLALLALPEVRIVMDQLAGLIEQAYTRQPQAVHSTGQKHTVPSPLLIPSQQQPQLLANIIQKHPDMGSTIEQLVQNFQVLRQQQDEGEHLNVEDVLARINMYANMPYIHYIHRYDSFLQAAVLAADTMVEVLLAKPRLLELAAAVLNCCLDSLHVEPGAQWKWSEPSPDKQEQTTALISSVLQRCPHIADSIATFAAKADAVQNEAATYRLQELRCTRAQLHERCAMCQHVGLFDRAWAQHTFAYMLVTHVDVLLADRV